MGERAALTRLRRIYAMPIGAAHLYTAATAPKGWCTANLRTKLLDFRGFDSSIILILRCGILMSIENLPDFLSQQILVHRENLSREIGLI